MQKDDHVQFDYNQITDEIYIGTNSCCTTHFNTSLLDKDILADISLENKKIDQPFGVKYYLWLPTIDHAAPSMEALALGIQVLTFLVNNKIKVYLHCQNGHGRAPTLVAAYFISQGMSVDKAIKKIKAKRREIHIEPVQKAALEQFAKKVKLKTKSIYG